MKERMMENKSHTIKQTSDFIFRHLECKNEDQFFFGSKMIRVATTEGGHEL